MASNKLPCITSYAGSGKHRVYAEVNKIGADVIIFIWGGTKPHIGSVAAAIPRQSLDDPERMSATSSVFNYVGHKDEMVSKLFSERIAAMLNCNCIATAGIHIDSATPKDVDRIMKNCMALCTRIQKLLEKTK